MNSGAVGDLSTWTDAYNISKGWEAEQECMQQRPDTIDLLHNRCGMGRAQVGNCFVATIYDCRRIRTCLNAHTHVPVPYTHSTLPTKREAER